MLNNTDSMPPAGASWQDGAPPKVTIDFDAMLKADAARKAAKAASQSSNPTQAEQASTLACMKAAKRWMVWRSIPDPEDASKKARKVPHYSNGAKRGQTDNADDWAQLVTYAEALTVATSFTGLGFALGPDGKGGTWQGIDLDGVARNHLADLANTLPGYVEMSPSGEGCHAIGYGAYFQTLGSNGTGTEAYAGGRFLTFTGNVIRDPALTDIANFVKGPLSERHSKTKPNAYNGITVEVEDKTITHLRSALAFMRSDDRQFWIDIGHALHELGEVGRGLWIEWAQTSDLWQPKDAKRFDGFHHDRTGYQSVFAKAQQQGWLNPASNEASTEAGVGTNSQAQGGFTFKFARPGEAMPQTAYLIDPWLPRATVIGCYGRGEAGKSSWTARACAIASNQVSTLWISSEERSDHIRQRHLSCGGEIQTLAVIETRPTKIDPKTKKPVATTFNIYEHMERAILDFQRDAAFRKERPLGVVVLDAVVALVTWAKGEGANDDAGVKRMIAYLSTLAERYGITFMILGHLNKGTSHSHIADAVTGAAAWTNSVRLAFMFAKDLTSEDYEGFVRTVKSNTGTHFGAIYKTVPVYTLRERPDGGHDVLCSAEMVSPTVWGELALREMMGDEDDAFLKKLTQKREKVQAIIDAMLQALQVGPTNRKAVEASMKGVKVNRRHWQAADEILAKEHRVQMENGPHDQRFYTPAKQVRR